MMEKCACGEKHAEFIEHVRQGMLQDELLYDMAELFKVFGDSTRVRLLCALSERELCVCDLADAISMTQSAVSHQLRILKQARLVRFRRNGKIVYYSLADEHVHTIFAQALEHIAE